MQKTSQDMLQNVT